MAKTDFQYGGRPPSRIFFLKNHYLVTWLLSSSKCHILYQISSKSDDFSLSYGDLTIFEMVAIGHVEIGKSAA